jgi:GNAT superfamily N-acetyltransferase
MSQISYRKLEKKDICKFIEMRLNQLQEEGAEALFDLAPALNEYYEKHLDDGTFISWLAIDGDEIIATSGMSFVEKPPYYSNPSGKIGLLSSMYTLKAYRRKGIAKTLLEKVIQEAKEYGCGTIQITASDMGILLYTDYGFEKTDNFMQLKIQ